MNHSTFIHNVAKVTQEKRTTKHLLGEQKDFMVITLTDSNMGVHDITIFFEAGIEVCIRNEQ